jgi:hypothetical protein
MRKILIVTLVVFALAGTALAFDTIAPWYDATNTEVGKNFGSIAETGTTKPIWLVTSGRQPANSITCVATGITGTVSAWIQTSFDGSAFSNTGAMSAAHSFTSAADVLTVINIRARAMQLKITSSDASNTATIKCGAGGSESYGR